MFPQFDKLKERAFSHVLDRMGEPAVWEKSNGESEDGRILFRYPTQPVIIGQSDSYEFHPNTPTAEWYKDTFIGLKELTDARSEEHLIIREERYFVIEIMTRSDGDTIVASLKLVN